VKHPEIHAILDGLLDAGDDQRLPELPNFGIFYLNIRNAAALIVEDLKRSGRSTFGVEDDGKESLARREKRFAKRIAELTTDLEARLLKSVENGRLRFVTQNPTLEDFLQRGDERHLPEYTYIHFSDLLKWLMDSGYVDRNSPTASPAFEEYERHELNLLEDMQDDLKLRRDQVGKRIRSYMNVLAPPSSEDDEQLRLKERLVEALERIQELERENQSQKLEIEQSDNKPINVRSKQAYLRMIALLCKSKATYLFTKRETIGIFERDTEKSPLALDNNTIRKIFKEVQEEELRVTKI
jgi:hypothetical protein